MLFGRFHAWFYERSGGRLGARMMGHDMALLWTTGRRSGELRRTALLCRPEGEDIIVVASFYGAPKHPAWFLNLGADPGCVVRQGRRKFPAVARVAEGAEHDRLWALMVETRSQYADYQARTERTIPVVVLTSSR